MRKSTLIGIAFVLYITAAAWISYDGYVNQGNLNEYLLFIISSVSVTAALIWILRRKENKNRKS